MTKATWNQKLETLCLEKTNDNWLGTATNVLRDVKPRSPISPFLYVSCMAQYLRAATSVTHAPDTVLPVQRFIEYLAAQPERVLFDSPFVYPNAAGMYLIKTLPKFFKDIDDSKKQSELFARAVAAADQASVQLLERFGENCGLLQQQSTDDFLKNTETYYSVFLRLCRDGLMKHGWTPEKKASLHPIWTHCHFKGLSGTLKEQREEEQTIKELAAILPASFETIVSCPYANSKGGKDFTPNMLETMAGMDMLGCHSLTRSQLLGNWCNEKNAGWAIVAQRYPDYVLAVDMYHGLLGNMAHYDNMDVMRALWEDHVVDRKAPFASMELPADFSTTLIA